MHNESFNPDMVDDNGDSLLHISIKNKSVDIFKYLVNTCKANVNIKNSSGKSLYDYNNDYNYRSYYRERVEYNEISDILDRKPDIFS